MEKYYQAYFGLLDGLSRQMEAALSGLRQEALDWMPGLEMNSIAVLAAHSAGAARFWIVDMAMGENANRNRPAEFQTHDVSAQALAKLLQDTMADCKDALDRLALEDLHAVRVHPVEGKEYSVAWCLNHALEHFALHLGHMEVTRQMWEMQNV